MASATNQLVLELIAKVQQGSLGQVDSLRKEFDSLLASMVNAQLKGKDFDFGAAAAQLERMAIEVSKLKALFDQLASSGILRIKDGGKVIADVKKIQDQIDRLGRNINGAAKEFRAFGDEASKASRKASEGTRRAATDTKKASEATENLARSQQKVKASTDAVSKSFFTVGRAIKGFLAVRLIIYLQQVAKSLVSNTIELEKLKLQFEGFSSTALEAAKDLQYVKDVGEELGLNFRSLTQGFLRLKAAAKGTSLEGETLNNIFSAIATTARAVNLDADQLKGSFFAVEQIISKNIVSAEELRRQLGDRIPGSFAIMARAIGVTTTQLDDMLEKGQLLSEVALPAFAAELEATFGGAAQKNAQSLNAQIGRIQNSLLSLTEEFGKGFGPKLSEALEDFIDLFSGIGDQAEEAGDRIGTQLGILSDAVVGTLALLTGNIDKALESFVELEFGIRNNLANATVALVDFGAAFIKAFDEKAAERAKSIIREIRDELREYWKDQEEAVKRSLKSEEELSQERISGIEKSIARQKQLREQYEAGYSESKNANLGFLKQLDLVDKAIEKIKDRNEGVFAPSAKEAERLKDVTLQLIPILESLGGDASEEARKRFLALAKTVKLTREEFLNAERSFKGVFEETTTDIKKFVVQVDNYEKSINQLAGVTKQQAEIMYNSAKKALDQILALPDYNQKVFEDVIPRLQSYLAKYKGFSKDVIKENQKIAERAERFGQRMVDSFAKAFQKLGESIEEETEKAKAKIKELEDALEGVKEEEPVSPESVQKLREELEALSNKTELTNEDFEKMEELENRLSDATFDLSDQLRKAKQDFENLSFSAEDVEETIQSLIYENEGFKKGFIGLSDSGKSAVRDLIVGFQNMSDQAGATKDDVSSLLYSLESVFKGEGLDPSSLRQAWDALSDEGESATDRLDRFIESVQQLEYSKRSEQKALEQNRVALGDQGAAAGEVAGAFDDLGGAVDGFAEGLDASLDAAPEKIAKFAKDVKGGISPVLDAIKERGGLSKDDFTEELGVIEYLKELNMKLSEAIAPNYDKPLRQVKESADEAKGSMEEAKKPVEEFGETTEETASKTQEFKLESEGLDQVLKDIDETVDETSDTFGDLVATYDKAGTAIQDLRQEQDTLRRNVDQTEASITNLDDAGEQLADGMVEYSGAVGSAVKGLDNLQIAGKLAADVFDYNAEVQKELAKELEKTDEEFDGIAETVGEKIPEGLEGTNVKLTETQQAFKTVEEAGKAAFERVQENLGTLNKDIQVTLDLCNQLKNCLASIEV